MQREPENSFKRGIFSNTFPSRETVPIRDSGTDGCNQSKGTIPISWKSAFSKFCWKFHLIVLFHPVIRMGKISEIYVQ